MRALILLLLAAATTHQTTAAPPDSAGTFSRVTLGGGLEVAHRAGASALIEWAVYPKDLPVGFGILGRSATYRAVETPVGYIRRGGGPELFHDPYDDPRDGMYFAALTASRLQRIRPARPGGAGSWIKLDAGLSAGLHTMTHFTYMTGDYFMNTSSYAAVGLYAAAQWMGTIGRSVDMGFGLWINGTARATPIGLELLFRFDPKAASK